MQKHRTQGQEVGVASGGTWSLGVAVPMILVSSCSMWTRGSSSGPFWRHSGGEEVEGGDQYLD